MDTTERHDLWEAMANLFLDTEMRDKIPSLAARCVRAGLSQGEAREVWRYQVTPAVWWNMWDVAGEWACWPREWLVERIENKRRLPALGAALRYWLSAWMIDPCWRAVERCMPLFASHPGDGAARLEAELSWLARVFFGCCFPGAMPALRSPVEMRRLYRVTFLPIFEPLVVRSASESLAVCRARVESVLAVNANVIR